MAPMQLAGTSGAGEVGQKHEGAGKVQRLVREVQLHLGTARPQNDKITLLHETVISTRQEVMAHPSSAPGRRRNGFPSLTTQIMVALIAGVLVGWLKPEWGNALYFLRDIFLNLIKSVIGPLIFSTLVVGIAGGGELRKVGRMGVKALIYFEIVTTAALLLGLAVVNVTKPGIGITLSASNEVIKGMGENHPRTLVETLVHVFPSSVVDSFVRGDILQIVAFAVLFAMAVSAIGEKGKPLLRAMESLSQVMFKFTNYVMKFAPFGVFAAIAHTVGTQGPGVLVSLGNLILTFYLAIAVFVIAIFGLIILL